MFSRATGAKMEAGSPAQSRILVEEIRHVCDLVFPVTEVPSGFARPVCRVAQCASSLGANDMQRGTLMEFVCLYLYIQRNMYSKEIFVFRNNH